MSNTLNNITPLANNFDTQSILSVPQTDTMSGKYVLVNDGSGKPWVMPASLFFAAANQAEVAAREAEAAAGRVDGVIVEAGQAAATANTAAGRANQAAIGVEQAITNANNAAGQAASAAESAGIAGGKANNAATAAENAAITAGDAAFAASEAGENAEIATQSAESAAALAKEVADHPTYIDSDGFVYIWNTDTKQYEKTGINVKGDPFKIALNYTSIAEMEDNFDNPEVPTGAYVMIKTTDENDPDNLKVFLKGSERFEYIGYMFGSGGGADIENTQIPFSIAAIRELIQSGSTLPVLFGQILRWFTDLKAMAFKDKVNWVTDIDDKPTIPAEQIQSDYAQTNVNAKDYIKNKPTIPSGQIPADWNQIDPLSPDYIKNKPIIPDEYDDSGIRQDIADNLVAAKTYTNEQIAQIVQFDIVVVPSLPASGVKGIIYLVPKEGSGNDVHNEYIWNATSGKFELIGSTSVDLSGYYTMVQADAKFALKTDIKNAYYLDITPLYSGDGFVSVTTVEFLDACAQAIDNKCVALIDHDTPFPGWVQSLTDKYVIVLSTSVTISGVYHPNNITISINKTTRVVSVEQTADLPESGNKYIELGDITQIDRVRTTSELSWSQFIKGVTMDDMEQAYQNNTPIYSMTETNYHSGKIGYSRCTSIVKNVDGTVVHYLLAFVISDSTTYSDNVYHYLLDLRGITGDNWKDASVRACLTYSKSVVAVGTSMPFTGGFVVMDLSTSGSRDLLINPAGFYPLHNSTTTVLLRNTSSLTTKLAFTIKLGADASSEGSKLLIVSELPELAGGEACEISILWADLKYIVRASAPFVYAQYVE